MNSKVCLLGCGYVLTRLAKQLGSEATILTVRDKTKLKQFENQGYQVVNLDLSNAQQVDHLLSNFDFDILIDSIPPVLGTDSGHLEFIDKLQQLSLRRVVFLSTTGVYGETSGKLVDENSETNPISQSAKNRLVVESKYRQEIQSSMILRLPAISGPERNPKDSFLAGHYPYIDNGSRFINRIHVNDLVDILKLIINSTATLPQVLNVTDGSNLTTEELLLALQKKYPEIKTPESISAEKVKELNYSSLLSNQQVSNQLLLETFGQVINYLGTEWM